ncbi:MAG TPA: hypothetical protein VGL51_18775, partial [Solirubrobacteraceae bacterium]
MGEDFGRRGSAARIVAALVAALAGVAVVVGTGGAVSAGATGHRAVTTTFGCLGIPEQFVVPREVRTIHATITGGSGGGSRGGGGGVVSGTLHLTPGDVLTVTVGCRESNKPTVKHGGGYGYADGGNGGSGFATAGASGGGATGVTLGTIILAVGGGGGGEGVASVGSDPAAGGGGGFSSGAAGAGSSGGAGGALGGSSKPAGGNGLEGNGREGGGGGGGFPHGGLGGRAGSFAFFGGGGGGGGLSYTDGNFVTDVHKSVGAREREGSVEFRYSGPDASPEIFRCTNRIQTYTAVRGITDLRVIAVGANGSVKYPEGSDKFTKPGVGDGLMGSFPTHTGMAIDIGVGCAGHAGQYAGGGTDRNPGGAGGFGLNDGGAGGAGYRSILDPRSEGGGAGGSGGGGSSGVREADFFDTRLVAGGGGGAGGYGE